MRGRRGVRVSRIGRRQRCRGSLRQGTGIMPSCAPVSPGDRESAALAPLVAYTGERTKPTRVQDDHPLAALLLRPNPWQSWYEFMELLITYLDLDGNAFVYKASSTTGRGVMRPSAQDAGARQVAGLFPLRSDRVRPVPGQGRTDPLLGYVYDPADSGFFEREPFLPEEIIHVKFPNPGDPFEGLGRGTSRLGAAAKSTDVDNAATSFLKTFFDQAVVPFGLLKSKQKMLDSEVLRVRERLRAQYGGAQNWGDVMILDADAEYQRLGLSMQEMTFGDLDARNEARICMVLEVPPIIVGAKVGLDRSTFANYGEARTSFWEDSLIPGIYRRFEDAFNGGLAGDGVWLAYDYSAVPALREDQTAKWETAARVFMGGLATRNEARAIVDLAPVPAAQDGFRRADEQRIGNPALTQTPNVVGDGTAELAQGSGDGGQESGKGFDGGDEYGLPFGIRRSFDCGPRAGGPRPYGHDDKQAGGDEARLTERLKIEATGTRRIARALRSQLALAVPNEATAETLMGAEERLRRGSQALQDECYRMMREAALLGIEAAQTGVEGMWGKGLRHEKADGIGIDWSLVNADVLRWLDAYAFDLVRSVDANSARALREAISRWAQNGLPLPDLIKELGPIFGTKRAAVIAATEVTRAFAEANLRAWKASGVVSQVGWRTANDERVCFPAWTMVETEHGPMPIQDVKPDMQVWTRQGLRHVKATNRREYAGPMVTINREGGQVTATANHPFWTLEQGWLEAGQLYPNHTLETFGKQAVKVLGVRHFFLGKPTDTPATGFKVLRLAGISFGVLMPISTVHLQGDTQFGQQKVNTVASHTGLLDEGDSHFANRQPNTLLQPVFSLRSAIAGKAAKLTILVRRLNSHRLSACATRSDDRWPPTFLRTVMAVEAMFSPKHLTTAFAGNILGFGSPALTTTNSKAVGLRAIDSKLFAADWASPGDFIGASFFVAGSTAITPSGSIRGIVKTATADRAVNVFTGAFALWLRKHQVFKIARHVAPSLTKIDILYRRLCAKSITVYDIEVEGAHEFYANGVLVHNCPICAPLGGLTFGDEAQPGRIEDQERRAAVRGIDDVFMHPGGAGAAERYGKQEFRAPPAHPRCRCWLVPIG